jgi:hypothetical protein
MSEQSQKHNNTNQQPEQSAILHSGNELTVTAVLEKMDVVRGAVKG